jgi:uncharacterized membrane protein YhaH (DUF805 family)
VTDPNFQQPVAGEPLLAQPFYGAPFGAAVQRFWKKYATFSGRASRSEYWWWFLVSFLVSGILSGLSYIGGGPTGSNGGPTALYIIFSIVLGIWGLATIVPSLAISWRRLHDSNHSGGFWFLSFIPLVGGIILLVFVLLPPDARGERFDR